MLEIWVFTFAIIFSVLFDPIRMVICFLKEPLVDIEPKFTFLACIINKFVNFKTFVSRKLWKNILDFDYIFDVTLRCLSIQWFICLKVQSQY